MFSVEIWRQGDEWTQIMWGQKVETKTSVRNCLYRLRNMPEDGMSQGDITTMVKIKWYFIVVKNHFISTKESFVLLTYT